MSDIKSLKFYCQKVIPLVYDDSLSYYEFLCKVCNKLNEVIASQNELSSSLNDNLFKVIKDIVDGWLDDGTLMKLLNETLTSFWVSPLWFGAKFDGVTDDYMAIQKAVNSGNVKFPYDKRTYVSKSINIPKSERIIDFNMCYTVYENSSPMFICNTIDAHSPIINITLKNGYFDLKNGGFCSFYNCYFVTLDNIRITPVSGSANCIHFYNGFNININNVNITGASNGSSNVSGNNVTGIFIESKTASVPDIQNITNVCISNCLIQRCYNGVRFSGVAGSTFDTNTMKNLGFSYCDIALNLKLDDGSIYNQNIDTVRAEYCDTLIYCNGFICIKDIYDYHCNSAFKVESDELDVFGSCCFFGESGNIVVGKNKGTINMTGVTQLLRSVTDFGIEEGTFYGSKQVVYREVVGFDRLLDTYCLLNGGKDYKEYELKLNGDKVTFYGNGYLYNVPDIGIINVSNEYITLRLINGKLQSEKRGSINYSDREYTVNEPSFRVDKNTIAISKVNTTIFELDYSEVGLLILYSDKEGVTLNNGGNKIINYPSTTVNLYNNPVLIASLGNGKAFLVKY